MIVLQEAKFPMLSTHEAVFELAKSFELVFEVEKSLGIQDRAFLCCFRRECEL